MTDFLTGNKYLTGLAEAFSDWERRGRGWQVFDYAVSLEPPFTPVKPKTPVIVPVQDDARLPRGFQRLLRANQQAALPTPNQTNVVGAVIKPTAFYRKETLSELEILLSDELEVSPALTAQFFLGLSYCPSPISLELIADAQTITLQMACDAVAALHLKNQLKTFFPAAFINERQNSLDAYLSNNAVTAIADFGLSRSFFLPLQTFRNFNPDPLTGLLSSLGNLQGNEKAVFQVLLQKTRFSWSEELNRMTADPNFKELIQTGSHMLKEKLSAPLFAVAIRIIAQSHGRERSWQIVKQLGGNLSQFSSPSGNELIALSNDGLSPNNHLLSVINRTSYRSGMLLNASELPAIAHLPAARVAKLKRFENNTKPAPPAASGNSFILGENRHLGETRIVSLSAAQRTRHLHVIGGTGAGKSNFLLHLIKQDLEQNRGLCVLDPHGDLIDSVMENIPESRLQDAVLFDPSDAEYPIGFNILQAQSELEKTLLASDLVATFRRFSTSWGDVMDSVLANAILAFVESSRGGTLFDLKRFLVEQEFRNEFLNSVSDEAVRYFWQQEYPLISGKPQSSILIRLDTFLRQKLVRNIVCQKEQVLNFRQMMDESKIFLVKLSQGLIGEENSYLLGTLLIAKLQQTALTRQDVDSSQRRFFAVYADEFHHFITPSLATLLSGIRKYGVGLTLAHQSFRQISGRDQELASSILANCGTRVCFRLGDADAEKFADGFAFFKPEHLRNLSVGEAIARIERADFDFNLKTPLVPPVSRELGSRRRSEIVKLTRQRYARPVSQVEAELIIEKTAGKTENVARPAREETDRSKAKTEKSSPWVEKTGENNNSHRYLQSIVKRIAEKNGFIATLEKPVLGGVGKVDVAVENERHKIACEIAVTNTAEYELGNIQKCLASGFDKVVVISTDTKHLQNIRNKAETNLPEEQLAKVHFLETENFHLFLESFSREEPAGKGAATKKVKGYKVKIEFKPVAGDGTGTRRQTLLDILSSAAKRKANNNERTRNN